MTISLSKAYLCSNCQSIGDSAIRCENCASGAALMAFTRIFPQVAEGVYKFQAKPDKREAWASLGWTLQ